MKKIWSKVLGIVLVAGIIACATTAKIDFTPGTYQGTADGFGGPMTAEVTVDASSILSVKILSHNDSASMVEAVSMALERVPQRIVDGQTLAVDGVSGASFTSKGIINAVTAALQQSGVNIAALQKRKAGAAVARKSVSETTDVIVIGAGGAGLAAAMSAQQNGAKVILLEKMAVAGGNTVLSGGAFNAYNPELQAQLTMNDANRTAIQTLTNKAPKDAFEAEMQQKVKTQYNEFVSARKPGLFDSPEWHALQTYNGGDYEGKPELIKTLTQNVPETYKWMTENGMQWSKSTDPNTRIFTVLGGLWQRANRPEALLGIGFIEMGTKYVEKNSSQIKLMYETKATELIVQNGRVTGVKAVGGNTDYTFTATKGVVLATGGFGGNVELREKHNKHWPSLLNAKSTNHSGATGDGIVMAEKVGANLVGMEWIQLLPMGDPNTGSLSGNIEIGVEDRFFVNKSGDRFVDEGGRRDDMSKALLEQPDAWLWVICDSQSYPNPDTTMNNFGETINGLISSNRAYGANTIAELAAKINVPAANLQKAVDEFNAGVAAGRDRLGRTLWRIKIDKPPFYAGARIPTVHHTMGGIEINAEAQVLNKSGQVIQGLYAAGETAGGVHGTNRLGGNALADIHTFGRIAGANAAKGR